MLSSAGLARKFIVIGKIGLYLIVKVRVAISIYYLGKLQKAALSMGAIHFIPGAQQKVTLFDESFNWTLAISFKFKQEKNSHTLTKTPSKPLEKVDLAMS